MCNGSSPRGCLSRTKDRRYTQDGGVYPSYESYKYNKVLCLKWDSFATSRASFHVLIVRRARLSKNCALWKSITISSRRIVFPYRCSFRRDIYVPSLREGVYKEYSLPWILYSRVGVVRNGIYPVLFIYVVAI